VRSAKGSGLLDKLNIGGLGDVVKSWIDTGKPGPVPEFSGARAPSSLGVADSCIQVVCGMEDR
jgi:uncharacterized protein YidB (DUF937 family)